MRDVLYLDTARLGKMSPRALKASIDFSRFASEHGCDPRLMDLLRDGFDVWPTELQDHFRGFDHWHAVGGFKSELKRLSQARSESDVLLAARSANLMNFAAKLFSGCCKRVLLTDSTWPAYRRRLAQEAETTATEVHTLPLRQHILCGGIDAEEIVDSVVVEFIAANCDGLFLPLVDNLGIRFPVERIVQELRSRTELRFVVVDGAQALGQVPLSLDANYCDFFLSGSHKWLRAVSTMGLGFFGNPATETYIRHSLEQMRHRCTIDDPLLTFTEELETGQADPYGETVNVAPLLIVSAAVRDALESKLDLETAVADELLRACQASTHWKPVESHPSTHSRIRLIRSTRQGSHNEESIRRKLFEHGVAATPYPDGSIRVSMPNDTLSDEQFQILATAMNHVA